MKCIIVGAYSHPSCESTAVTLIAFSATCITIFLFRRHRCYGWCGVSVSLLGHGSGRLDTSLLSMTGVVSAWAITRCCLALTQFLAEIYSDALKLMKELTKILNADGLFCRLNTVTSTST